MRIPEVSSIGARPQGNQRDCEPGGVSEPVDCSQEVTTSIAHYIPAQRCSPHPSRATLPRSMRSHNNFQHPQQSTRSPRHAHTCACATHMPVACRPQIQHTHKNTTTVHSDIAADPLLHMRASMSSALITHRRAPNTALLQPHAMMQCPSVNNTCSSNPSAGHRTVKKHPAASSSCPAQPHYYTFPPTHTRTHTHTHTHTHTYTHSVFA